MSGSVQGIAAVYQRGEYLKSAKKYWKDGLITSRDWDILVNLR